ncbi:MAG: hypothetical protein FIB01_07625 [Gemmatimonadetes bacterium]|nr:hypothetical protein [Gemmatimonadota bacterium]
MVAIDALHGQRRVGPAGRVLLLVPCLLAGSPQTAFAQARTPGCVPEPTIGKTVGAVTSFRQKGELTSYGSVELVRRTLRRAIPERLQAKGYDVVAADLTGLPEDVQQWPRRKSDVAAAMARQNLTALVVVEFQFSETQSLWSWTATEGQPGYAGYRTYTKTLNSARPMPSAAWSEWMFACDGTIQHQTSAMARAGWKPERWIQANTYDAVIEQLVAQKIPITPKPLEAWARELAAAPALLTQLPRYAEDRPALGFASVSAGFDHACGLTPEGAAYCWGSNTHGQLGGEVQDACPLATPNFAPAATVPCSVPPVRAGAGLTFRLLRAGEEYTCGLTLTGEAYCWGSNLWGRLGDGTDTTRSAPVRVATDVPFDSLYLGGKYSCGLTAGGEAYCWGYNGFGQLGDSTTVDRRTPVAVKGGVSFATLFPSFLGPCGLDAAGAAHCWGGMATTGPVLQRTTSRMPLARAPGPFARLVLDWAMTCGLAVDGTGYCWSGTGDPYVLGSAGRLREIYFNDEGNPCGITRDADKRYCWKRSSLNEAPRRTPNPATPKGSDLTFAATTRGGGVIPDGWATGEDGFTIYGYTRTRQEGTFTCGVSGGAVYCWGANYRGQLGDRTKTNRETPVRVR